MTATPFTKADVERAVSGAVSGGIVVSEVRIEKITGGTVIQILTGGLSGGPVKEDDEPKPEPW